MKATTATKCTATAGGERVITRGKFALRMHPATSSQRRYVQEKFPFLSHVSLKWEQCFFEAKKTLKQFVRYSTKRMMFHFRSPNEADCSNDKYSISFCFNYFSAKTLRPWPHFIARRNVVVASCLPSFVHTQLAISRHAAALASSPDCRCVRRADRSDQPLSRALFRCENQQTNDFCSRSADEPLYNVAYQQLNVCFSPWYSDKCNLQ